MATKHLPFSASRRNKFSHFFRQNTMRKCLNATAAYILRWTAQSSQSMLEGQSSAAAEQSGGRAGTQWSEKLGPGIWPGLTSRSSPGPVLTSSPAREAGLFPFIAPHWKLARLADFQAVYSPRPYQSECDSAARNSAASYSLRQV